MLRKTAPCSSKMRPVRPSSIIYNEKTLELLRTSVVSRPYPFPYGFVPPACPHVSPVSSCSTQLARHRQEQRASIPPGACTETVMVVPLSGYKRTSCIATWKSKCVDGSVYAYVSGT